MPSYQTVEGISLNNAEGTVLSVLPYLSKYFHTFTKVGEKNNHPQTVCLCIDMFIPILPERKQRTQFIY